LLVYQELLTRPHAGEGGGALDLFMLLEAVGQGGEVSTGNPHRAPPHRPDLAFSPARPGDGQIGLHPIAVVVSDQETGRRHAIAVTQHQRIKVHAARQSQDCTNG
jgi:hypothetical protein